MSVLQPTVSFDGKKGFILLSDKNDHWYKFFSSLEVKDVTWLEDALSLKRAFSDVEAGHLSSHEKVKSEMQGNYSATRY
ncbi:MAG: hypothetical protein QME81_12975 [bacterium]|nr:hypothetical protein [bacterium]